jgi:hypothetical protein
MPEAPVGSLAGKTRQADENKRDFPKGGNEYPGVQQSTDSQIPVFVLTCWSVAICGE